MPVAASLRDTGEATAKVAGALFRYGAPVTSRLLLLLALAACRNQGITQKPGPDPMPKCGDGTVDTGEDCDGSNLNGATCQSRGFVTGTLNCSARCTFLDSLCGKPCGNGALDTGEACDGDAGVGPCAQFGYFACTDACTVDLNHCIATPLVGAPALQLAKGGPAALGDLSPKGLGDLVMAVPSFSRVETFPYSVEQGLQGSAGRKLSFQRTPQQALVADVDDDGNADVVTVNDDGSVDRYRFNGTGFTPSSWPDAGCAASALLGSGRFLPDSGAEGVAALACADAGTFEALLLFRSAAAPTLALETPGGLAAALADTNRDGRQDLFVSLPGGLSLYSSPDYGAPQRFTTPADIATPFAAGDLDGDGDADLAVATPVGVAIYEQLGTDFARRQVFLATLPRFVQIVDVDLDGRPDVLWSQAASVELRRNRGAFAFSPFSVSTGTGAPLSPTSSSTRPGEGHAALAFFPHAC
jgi:hypothetical protein